METVDNAKDEFDRLATAGELYNKINTTISKKHIEDINFTIKDFEYVLKVVKGKLRDPGEYGLRVSPVIPKVEKVIQQLEKKRDELNAIIEGKNTKDLSRLSMEIADFFKNSESKEFSQELARSLTNQQSELVDVIKSDISKYYQGWGDIYKQLEDAYRESAMALNRYHLHIDSKSLKYSDELIDSKGLKEFEEQLKQRLGL